MLDEVLDAGGELGQFAAVGGVDLVHRDDESVAAFVQEPEEVLTQCPPRDLAFGREGRPRSVRRPYASSLCGACFDACPVKINIPDILVHLRGKDVDAHRGGLPTQMDLGMKAASWALSSGSRLGAVEKLLPLGRIVAGPDKKITKLPGLAAGWTQSRDIPAPPAQSFRDWWAREHTPDRPHDPQPTPPPGSGQMPESRQEHP